MNLFKKWQTIFDNDEDDDDDDNNNNKLNLNSRINYEKIKLEIQFRLICFPPVKTNIKVCNTTRYSVTLYWCELGLSL
jgi:hypothetical protein